ncbi:MAG: phage tail tape measure protein [Chloroflexi bacterium]|nr:phage tail tape measure protein [Chloroflexota bacterium]
MAGRNTTLGILISAIYKGQGVGQAKGDLASLEKVTSKLGKVATGALVEAGVAAVKFGVDSVKAFTSFDKGMREVFTLMPGITEEAMAKMKGDVLAFAQEAGRLPEEVIPAVYQSISAGVPPQNVFDFLRTASDAALGGVTGLETAVDGITSVVNAYGKEAITAGQASDLMFTAVKGGKTTFDELSRSLFNVLPIAAGVGVGFGNITAALAAMTSQGVPTAVATTQLRQLLVELSKAGSQAALTFERAAGKSFKEFIAEGGNLNQALQIMKAEADAAGVGVNDLFGSVEAGGAALVLAGDGAAKFATELEKAEEATGATGEAAETMADSAEQSVRRMQAAFETLKVQAGQSLAPTVTKAFEGATKQIQLMAQTTTWNRTRGQLKELGASWSDLDKIIVNNKVTFDLWRTSADFERDLRAGENGLRRMELALQLVNQGLEIGTQEFFDYLNAIDAANMRAEAMNNILAAHYGVAVRTTGGVDALATATGDLAEETAELSEEEQELIDKAREAEGAFLDLGYGATTLAGHMIELQLKEAGVIQEQGELVSATEAVARAMQAAQTAVANYFGEFLRGEAEDFNDILLEQAIAAGASAETLRAVALATGNYSPATIDAAIAAAQLRAEQDKLKLAIDAGRLTFEQAIEANRLLEEGLVSTAGEAIYLAKNGFDDRFSPAMLNAAANAGTMTGAMADQKGLIQETQRELELYQGFLDGSYAQAAASAATNTGTMTEAVAEQKRLIEEDTLAVGGLTTAAQTYADGSPYAADVEADTDDAEEDVDRLAQKLLGIPDRTVTVTTRYETQGTPPPGAGGPQGPPEEGGGTAGQSQYGGLITGGIPGRDSVLRWLMPGEYVVRKRAVDRLGLDALRTINQGHLPASVFAVAGANGAGQSSRPPVILQSNDKLVFIVANRQEAGMAAAMAAQERRQAVLQALGLAA